MADMSFKQAKEIADRLELAELSLKHLLTDVQKATNNFEQTLKKQNQIMHIIPNTDKKLVLLKVLVGINIGFVIGVLVGKFFL
jgi:hypothetical protein